MFHETSEPWVPDAPEPDASGPEWIATCPSCGAGLRRNLDEPLKGWICDVHGYVEEAVIDIRDVPEEKDKDTRYAVVSGRDASIEKIQAYLPANYTIVPRSHATMPDGQQRVGISGSDDAGWTLDGYVIPRLQSGLYGVQEVPSLRAIRDRTGGVLD